MELSDPFPHCLISALTSLIDILLNFIKINHQLLTQYIKKPYNEELQLIFYCFWLIVLFSRNNSPVSDLMTHSFLLKEQ